MKGLREWVANAGTAIYFLCAMANIEEDLYSKGRGLQIMVVGMKF